MNDEDSDIARDAYSHWCAYTAHPECDENGQKIKTYYIYTDAGSEEIEAASLEEALAEWGEAPKWVRDGRSFERWLNKVGGFGAIQEDGVEIARVDA
jgi:DNA-binding PadR family transcriptional regulator